MHYCTCFTLLSYKCSPWFLSKITACHHVTSLSLILSYLFIFLILSVFSFVILLACPLYSFSTFVIFSKTHCVWLWALLGEQVCLQLTHRDTHTHTVHLQSLEGILGYSPAQNSTSNSALIQSRHLKTFFIELNKKTCSVWGLCLYKCVVFFDLAGTQVESIKAVVHQAWTKKLIKEDYWGLQ